MPDPETEYGLRIQLTAALVDCRALRVQLATALRERDNANARAVAAEKDYCDMAAERSALRQERADLRAEVTRLREALAQMIELADHADSKDPHSPWCNGVHSEQGQCEGDYIAAGIIGNAHAALASGGDRG